MLQYLAPEQFAVFDLETLRTCAFHYGDDEFVLDDGTRAFSFDRTSKSRGWLRRLAPEGWQRGTAVGSLRATETAAWLALVGAFARGGWLEWLTDIDVGLVAENKLGQLEAAQGLGIDSPRTVVTNDLDRLSSTFAEPWLVKALGPAHFYDQNGGHVVFGQSVTRADLGGLGTSPPMLFQELLPARHHLRVVCVGDNVWCGCLNADGLPVDWRSDNDAHDSFRMIDTPTDVETGARRMNDALGIRYSSQDWIVTQDRSVLIDVNPNGQWLFLPEPIATEVSKSIASWLSGRDV